MKRVTFSLVALLALAVAPAWGANEQAENAYYDGLEALAAGNYGEAEKALTKAISLDEENAGYYQSRGVARTLGENFAGALTDLQRVARLATAKDWETTGWIAIANKMNGNLQNPFIPGTAPRAETDYAVALSDMGQNYWQSKNNGSYYDKAQKKTVATTGAYKGDFAKVAAFYVQKHMAGVEGGNKALAGRVQSRISAGQYAEALQSLQGVLATNPGDPDLLMMNAQIHLGMNDAEGARGIYTDVLTRRITAAAYIGRAKAAAKLGDAARAVKDLASAAKLDAPAAAVAQKELAALLTAKPADPQALWARLEAQCKAGEAPGVVQETALALVRAMGAGRIRYDEHYQDRLAVLEADLKAHPNAPEAMIALGRFLHDEATVLDERVGPRAEAKAYRIQSPADMKRDTDRAAQLVETALQKFPNNVAAMTLQTHLKIAAGDYDEAQTIVVKALAIKKDDPDLLEELASLLQIQAARHISAAGNLRQMKSWYETDFDQYPPVEYIFRRLPTAAELAQAAEEEARAAELSKFAQERLTPAAEGAGPTARGWYYRATLLMVRGDTAGAKEAMTKAVTMQPDYQQAWYQLAAICTAMLDGDGAIAARAKAYNLSQTTASAQLNALWYLIPHNQFKSGRQTVAEGVKIDAGDGRLAAYLAVMDEATEKPQEAMAHYAMARAISEAALALHGMTFVPASKPAATAMPLAVEMAGLPAVVRLRMAALLFEQGKAGEAGAEFTAVTAALATLPAAAQKVAPADTILPNPEAAAGVVPLAESVAFLQIRAEAGSAYARWAAGKAPADVDFAAKQYRRMLVSYTMKMDTAGALKAIADLGLAELYVRSRQMPEAAAALQSTPAMPQDFWQEMRATEAAVRSPQNGR